MKTVYCAMFVLVILFCDSATTKEISMNGLKTEVEEVMPSGSITVRISNSSKDVIKLWKQSNGWGAACWRVLLIRNGRLETFFQNPDQAFTRNVPSFTEIVGGSHIELRLDLNGGNWCGFDHCTSFDQRGFNGKNLSFAPNDLVIVVYDVPYTVEATRLGVWYGFAATSTIVH
jgi:hypothetical protein